MGSAVDGKCLQRQARWWDPPWSAPHRLVLCARVPPRKTLVDLRAPAMHPSGPGLLRAQHACGACPVACLLRELFRPGFTRPVIQAPDFFQIFVRALFTQAATATLHASYPPHPQVQLRQLLQSSSSAISGIHRARFLPFGTIVQLHPPRRRCSSLLVSVTPRSRRPFPLRRWSTTTFSLVFASSSLRSNVGVSFETWLVFLTFSKGEFVMLLLYIILQV